MDLTLEKTESGMASHPDDQPGTDEAQISTAGVVIRAPGAWPGFGVPELVEYRGLLVFLVWRTIKVRYAQTVIGMGWAVIQPVLTMLVFTVVFGSFAGIPSDGIPYPIFTFAALVPWTYFSQALTGATNSLIGSTNLITKVYFPRLIIPLTPVLSSLVDFTISFVLLLVVLMPLYGMWPPVEAILVVPILLAIAILTAAGVGCLLSAINIQYRDVKHITPFLVQIWMYGTPIVYPLSLVPDAVRPFYLLNPMVGVIEGFRTVLLGTGSVSWSQIGLSGAVATGLFLIGTLYFRRTERVFADVI